MVKIITIVGGSGSGKGFLSKKIKESFGEQKVSVIPHDMYYYPASVFPKHLEFEFYDHQFKNFDTPEALETELLIEHLVELKNGNEVHIPEYDFGNNEDKIGKRHRGALIKPSEYIIVDGIFSLNNKHLRKLTDVSIYIEVSPVNQMARRFMRDWGRGQSRSDMGQPGMGDDILFYVHHVRKGFNEFVLPSKQHADLVVNNDEWIENDDTPQMVDVAVNYLRGKFAVQDLLS